ncbi:MAG: O-antigen ligase family protein [Anaerolineae bacterium]|nr:O-antigen ligase family protein [Anaerolineae bacterium]
MTLLDRARQQGRGTLIRVACSAAVLILAFVLGFRPSPLWLVLLVGAMGAAAVIQYPPSGLVVLVLVALFVPMEFDTGTAVALNPVSLMVPVLLALWLLDRIWPPVDHSAWSPMTRPLALFLLANLFSLLIGIVFWDPAVPRSGNFTLVQLAQWALFFFSAGAFWLSGNLIRDQVTLRRLTFLYLALYGAVVILFTYPQLVSDSAEISRWVNSMLTTALHRAPFWLVLAAIAGGQLLFNEELSTGWRSFLWLVLGGVLIYVLHLMRGNASNWIGVAAAAGVLAWLRWPRLRWPAILLLVVLAGSGLLTSTVYEFAGGDEEWVSSGASRLVLIGRVLEVTLRNPITGLGPAAYRPYAAMEPLQYGLAFWVNPVFSSHNNYVDLFAHGGILGLGLFCWFAVEVARTGLRLRAHFRHGFAAGYVNGMLAAGAGALVLMLFLDWILPFVYNVAFSGFQASVLVWLFMGGLLALERMADQGPMSGTHDTL